LPVFGRVIAEPFIGEKLKSALHALQLAFRRRIAGK
jgi:hypothetical protein